MRRRSKAERVDIALHLLGVDPDPPHAFLEQGSVVETLGATEDFLAAHEEVVRVRERRLGSVGHSVCFVRARRKGKRKYGGEKTRTEGTECEREFVDDVVVSVVLLLDEDTKGLLGCGSAVQVLAINATEEEKETCVMSS